MIELVNDLLINLRNQVSGWKLLMTCVLMIIAVILFRERKTVKSLNVWTFDVKPTQINKKVIIIGMSLSFVFSMIIACNLLSVECPDEGMRFDLVLWIYNNGRLPVGDESDLISQTYGISYGFRPYLIQLISVLFMKCVGLFTTSSIWLLIAARLPSVISYTLLFFVFYLIGIEVFDDITAVSCAVMSVCIPQITFLSGYVNNDEAVLLECSILALIWIKGYKYGWTTKRCVFHGIVVGITLLTYLNACSYVLCAIIVYLYGTFVREKMTFRKAARGFLITAAAAFVIAGWYFIRNYIIYDGDVMGSQAITACAELNAIDELKPSMIYNGINSGQGFWSYFFIQDSQYNWFELSFRSLIGCFGGLEYWMSEPVYIIYKTLFLSGFGCTAICLFKENRISRINKIFYIIIIFVCLMLPWGLSAYNSYFSEYQSQGRYVIMCLVPLILISSTGVSLLAGVVSKKTGKIGVYHVVICALMTILILVMGYEFVDVMVKNCFGTPIISL